MALRRAKVTRKGQVTIPIDIREKLQIKEGDVVIFEERDGQVTLLRPEDVVARTAGIFNKYLKEGEVVEFDREKIWEEIAAERNLSAMDDA